jgi:hypothetical protein
LGRAKSKDSKPMPDDYDTLEDEGEVGSARASYGSGGDKKSKPDHEGVPRWRQIEIMRERRALKALLDDFGDDDLELDDDIFGSDAEREAYYRAVSEAGEEEEEFEVEIEEEDDFEEDSEEE